MMVSAENQIGELCALPLVNTRAGRTRPKDMIQISHLHRAGKSIAPNKTSWPKQKENRGRAE